MASESIDWLVATTGQPFGYYRWLTNRVGLGGPLAAIGMEGDVILASHGDEVHHQPHDSYGVRHVASCSQLSMMVNTHALLPVKEMQGKPVRRIGLAAPASSRSQRATCLPTPCRAPSSLTPPTRSRG